MLILQPFSWTANSLKPGMFVTVLTDVQNMAGTEEMASKLDETTNTRKTNVKGIGYQGGEPVLTLVGGREGRIHARCF